MYICKKCGKEVLFNFGSGIFCSRKCANSRIFTEESNLKKSNSCKKTLKEKGAWGILIPKSREEIDEITKKNKKTWRKKLLSRAFESMHENSQRKRIIIEQDGKCNKCGLNEWQGEKLTLEIEHLNGDHKDSRRENVIALCPNCHSLSKTWRGRNKKEMRGKVSSQEIYDAYKKHGTIRQALIAVGLVPKGDSYIRARRIIQEHSVLEYTEKTS